LVRIPLHSLLFFGWQRKVTKETRPAINKEIENSEAFKAARRKHSAVESSINALENHGLDRCPDHGIKGFAVSNSCITIYFYYQLCIKGMKKSISLKILTHLLVSAKNPARIFAPKTKNPGFSFRL